MDSEQSNLPIPTPIESRWIKIFRVTVWLLAVLITGFTLYGILSLYHSAQNGPDLGGVAIAAVLILVAPVGLAEILLAWFAARQLSRSLYRAWIIHVSFVIIFLGSVFFGLLTIFHPDPTLSESHLTWNFSLGLACAYGGLQRLG